MGYLDKNFTKPKRDAMGDEYVVHIPSGVIYYLRSKGYQPPQPKPAKRYPRQGDLLEGAPDKPMARARVTRMAGQRGDDNA